MTGPNRTARSSSETKDTPSVPSETESAHAERSEARRDRRSLRATAPVTQSFPRPMRYALGVGALAVALVGSLSFANAAISIDNAGQDAVADVSDVTGRDDVWAQVSRSDGDRQPLELEAGETVGFTVTVDGKTVDLTTTSSTTLADALIDAGIVVDLDDVVSAPMGDGVSDGAEITVERVGTQVETEVEDIPFETVEQETSSLPSGTTEVETEGVAGSRVTTYQAEYSDGDVVDRTQLNSVVAAQPVDEVVLVGTGATTSASDSSEPADTSPQPVTYSGGDPRAIAQEMLAGYGWGSDQWGCLDSLWQKESGWNPYAANPSSGAYGIPQSLPGSKMASAGADWQTNPATQIKWGLGYIQGRYGSPCGAWSHSQSVGWY
jgi:hypothetical protein